MPTECIVMGYPTDCNSLKEVVISSPLPISLGNIELDDVEIIELEDVDIQVTFNQSQLMVSFSESAFDLFLTVTTMRPDGHYGFRQLPIPSSNAKTIGMTFAPLSLTT